MQMVPHRGWIPGDAGPRHGAQCGHMKFRCGFGVGDGHRLSEYDAGTICIGKTDCDAGTICIGKTDCDAGMLCLW